MRAVVVLVFVIAAVFAGPGDHCLSSSFKANAALLVPHRGFDDLQTIYFDSVSNKQLLEMHVLEPTDVHIKLYMRYDLQHGYEYLPANDTCRVFPLQGNLEEFCILKNATYRREVVIGGELSCSVWDERFRGFQVRLIIAQGPVHGVPVNIYTRGGHSHSFQEWWDFEGHEKAYPDQTVFDLPSACVKTNAAVFDSPALNKARQVFGFLADF